MTKPKPPKLSPRPDPHAKKPSITPRELRPQNDHPETHKPYHKREFSKKTLQLDLSNNGLMPMRNYEIPPMSSKSYHEINRTPLFSKKKGNGSSRNSSVRSKENQPPMKSILKQKKPKFVARNDENEEESENERKTNRTNRESFQTICMTELNDSKSKKSQDFSSSDEEEEMKKEKKENNNNNKPLFNPLKIHLKLDDLLNPEKGEKNRKAGGGGLYLNSGIEEGKRAKGSVRRNENVTTTDTSKEDQTKFNKLKIASNLKNDSLSSSSLSDFHKIEEIVHSNMDFQKKSNKNGAVKKKKASESSSQFNHISEEASEFFREEVEE